MNLNNIDMDKLTGIMTASAIEVLGGESGNDYGSWAQDIVQDGIVKLLELDYTPDDVYNLLSPAPYW